MRRGSRTARSQRGGSTGSPRAELRKRLKWAGVKILVCGQSLERKKLTDEDSNELRAREAVLVRDPKVEPRDNLFEIAR